MAVGNTFGATALSSYGGFWIAYGSLFHPDWNIFSSNEMAQGEYAVIYTPEDRFSAVGFFLTGWFIFTTLLVLCTLKSTVMFFMLFYTPEDRYSALGMFLTAWFIFTFLMMLCSLKSTLMFFMLFFMADLGFLLLACENYAGSLGNETAQIALQKTGGVFGMFAAFLAWYNALAGIQDNRYVP